jgi:site-specific DNA recombinase
MPAAVIFCRVSTAKQAARNESNLPTQQKRCEDWCKHESIPVLRIFVAEGESAYQSERPIFEECLDFIQQNKGHVSVMVVQDLSRFSRNIQTQAFSIDRLRKLGVRLVSCDEPSIDESPAGVLLAALMGGMAEFYSHSLSSRVRYRFMVNREAGRWLHMAPTGLRNESKTLVLDESAKLVRECFEMVSTGAYTSDYVRTLMTAAGLRTKKGKKLTRSAFSAMLKNKIYCGVIRHAGKEYVGNFPALVTPELWQRAQDAFAGRKKSAPKKPTNEQWPLRGFVRCANCGAKLTSGNVKGRSKTYPKYWCWAAGCVNPVNVSKEELEDDWLALLSLLEPTADALVNILPKMAAHNLPARLEAISERQRVQSARLSDKRALHHALIDAKLRGELDQNDFADTNQRYKAEIAEIEEAQKTLISESDTLRTLSADTERKLTNLLGTWKKAGLSVRQELQSSLFPDGLVYSESQRFLCTANESLQQALFAAILEEADVHGTELLEVGLNGRGERI